MDGQTRDVVILLSADEENVRRLRSLWVGEDALEMWHLSDPEDLLPRWLLCHLPEHSQDTYEVAGAILDMTDPSSHSTRRRSEHAADEVHLAMVFAIVKGVDRLVTLMGGTRKPPVLVISNDEGLQTQMHGAGLAFCLVSDVTSGDCWCKALDAVRTAIQRTRALARRHRQAVEPLDAPSPAAVRLRDDLYFEPDRCEVVREGRHIELTARECALLGILLKAPCTYLSAAELGRRLTRPGGWPVEAHSIEQTISTLRRKLSDVPGSAQLLRTRRGIGYGIFPQTSPPTLADAHSGLLGAIKDRDAQVEVNLRLP